MALEQLGQTFDVVDPRTGDAISVSSMAGDTCFIEPRGILYTTSAGRWLIQYDGAAYLVGHGRLLYSSASEPAMMTVGGSTGDALLGRLAYGEVGVPTASGNLSLWERDPITLVGTTTIAIPTIPWTGHNGGRGMLFLPDRAIRPNGAYVWEWDAGSSAWVVETALAISDVRYASWAGAGRVWFANRTGEAVLYDYVAREVVRTVRTGVACYGLYYWRKHGIFVSLHATGSGPYALQTRVWADSTAPTSVSAPTLSAAATAGRQYTVTARVTGASGEPCEGEVVGWTATQGTLGNTSSVTDDDGYATTTIVLPADASGSFDIDAEVHV
jgi:hypothetical protein